MKTIDMASYPRRDHFEHFIKMRNPFLSVTAQLDITEWLKEQKRRGEPFFLSIQYAIGRAANAVPQLRQRIKDGGIVEYDYSRCSYIVLCPDDSYRYVSADTSLPFNEYKLQAQANQKRAVESDHLVEQENALSYIFVTCLPWMSFTDISLPYEDSSFSNPSFAVGKYCEENGRVKLPVTIMVNHAVADGLHLGRFFQGLEAEIQNQWKDGANA